MEKRDLNTGLTLLVVLCFLSGCKNDIENTLSNIQKKPAPSSVATRVIGTNAQGGQDSVDIFPYPLYNQILEQVPQWWKVVLDRRFQTDNGVDQADANLLATKQANTIK